MDPQTNTQKFHLAHKDDIMSIAIHPSGKFIATGEIGPKPLISVWSIDNVQAPVASFSAPLVKGVQQLTFSPSGQFLAGAAMNDSHNIAIFDWNPEGKSNKKQLALTVASGKGPLSPVTSLVFGPTEQSVVCCAVKELMFVDFSSNVFKSKRGIGCQETVLCAAFVGNKMISGTF